jgi:hypothetical protein
MATIRPADADIAHARAVLIDHRSVLQDQIERLSHVIALVRKLVAAYVMVPANASPGSIMASVVLSDRTIIRVRGADAEHLLQNIVTADLDTLESRTGETLLPC